MLEPQAPGVRSDPRSALSKAVDQSFLFAYHFGMPRARVYWTLVFTAAGLEHLAERNIGAADVADAVYGRNGPARVRRVGRGARQRWFVVAPLDTGEFLTCVFRAAQPRDLETEGAFVVSSTGRQEPPSKLDSSMRLCVSARVSDEDEVRSYRRWRGGKGGS
jgi:hypothetical protein